MGLHIAHWRIAGRTLAPLELNEVMYTLELGIVTAGFIFMSVAVLATAIFGRFFCSWGCHILALQDLCAWLLGRIGIRPRPVRSRALMLVAPMAMAYMFLWPQVWRLVQGRSFPGLRLAGDAQGWASFVTSDYWRNLPGPWIAILTFAICGFAIVYVLGSRSFCRYACPYGVIFGLADRVAPGRIVARGDCTGCGLCTAACQSHIRVHEELTVFGKVVSQSCLKDLDCVSVCPTGAVAYGFTRPSLLAPRKARLLRRRAPHFSWAEEGAMAAVFLLTLLVYRGLYGSVPFLMTLGLGAIAACAALTGLRLVYARDVRCSNFQLKLKGRVTRAGWTAAACVAAFALLSGHSGLIRLHESIGDRAFARAAAGGTPSDVEQALRHLEVAYRWGLVRPADRSRKLATLHLWSGAPDRARPHLDRMARRAAAQPHELLAAIELGRGNLDAAERAFRAAVAHETARPESHMALGELLAQRGGFEEAAACFEAAARGSPGAAAPRYNLGVVLTQLGREEEALEQYRAARRLDPRDAQIENNLGFLLARRGRAGEAEPHLRRAIQLDPRYSHAHFNLGRLLLDLGRGPEGEAHLRTAADIDPAYARLLGIPATP
jgi:Flp pilus assembly protein TadD/polyferredoxin